jgi:transglutaminase-like putative cysteine protease
VSGWNFQEVPVVHLPISSSSTLGTNPLGREVHPLKLRVNASAGFPPSDAVRRWFVLGFAIAICAALHGISGADADEWQPISPEELKMTSLPEAPGAPAVILYRQVDRDDNAKTGNEQNYVRIKILTEEGRKYADVEIPFFHDQGNVIAIRGRTVRPDGSVANFDGKTYDKMIVKARGVKYQAKTFTLPDVQVGSIVEYRYAYDMAENYVYDSHWILSNELFTRRAKFSLKPNREFALRWSWPVGLPQGTNAPKQEPSTTIVRMESQNIPAFQVEDFMPPENELKFRVDFEYSEGDLEQDPVKFWRQRGKKLNGQVESFLGKPKSMEQAVAQIVSPSDSPEVKAQKIYARVQQLRNTSYEVEKTDQEQKRAKAKEGGNAEELLKLGYGNGRDITWTYLALVRAAGIEAYPVWVSSRSEYFFNPKLMRSNQLNANLALLKLNGKEVYCDPGTAYVPFGLLPWGETAVTGLKLDKDGGNWVTTTLPGSLQSQIDRKAEMKLLDDGTLAGKVTVTFSGLEAMSRRVEERNEDEAARKKYLEDQLREYIPVGVEADLTNKPEWSNAGRPLVAVYDLKVPGWASAAGHRALLPVGLFSATEKQLFEHANRVHPIYFQFPFEKHDDVTIDLPLGWNVSSVPKELNQDAKAVAYDLKVENDKGTLHLTRLLRCDLLMIEQKLYPTLRAFFQTVRTGDEEQIIVQPGAAAASK